jgi:hypothetical protein
VVERDDGDRRRERARGLVEIGERDGTDVVALGLQHVAADRAERAGEAARTRADLEHARGRLREVLRASRPSDR